MTSPTNPFHSIGARIVVSSGKSENVAIQILDSEVKLGCDVTIEGNNKSLKILGTDSGIDVSNATVGTLNAGTMTAGNMTSTGNLQGKYISANNSISAPIVQTNGVYTNIIYRRNTSSPLSAYIGQLTITDQGNDCGIYLENTNNCLVDTAGFCSFPNSLLGWYYLHSYARSGLPAGYTGDYSANLSLSFVNNNDQPGFITDINWVTGYKKPAGKTIWTLYLEKDSNGVLNASRGSNLYIKASTWNGQDYPQVFALIVCGATTT